MKKILTLFITLIMLNSMSFIALGADSEIIAGSDDALQIIERKNAPLNPEFSEQNLEGINVSEATLQEFSNFFVWLEEQGIDPKAEGVHLIYVDDDLQTIPNSWVFTLSDYKPRLEASKTKDAEKEIAAKDEMISYLSNFEKTYPIKRVDTGLVTFVTVENKEVLLAEISEQDIRMLEKISDAVIEELMSKRNEVLTLNWSSGFNGTPNLHEDMARWAAEKAGFNSSMANRIGSYADEPDDPNNMTYDSDISSNNGLPDELEKTIESNYIHYFNPTLNLGGAPNQISKYVQRATITSSPADQRAINLSYASHFICDMSMPFHTNDALLQSAINQSNALLYATIPEPHLVYENDYVGQNWTSGLKFSSVARNANYAYGTANPAAHNKILAAYSHSYSSTVLSCTLNNDFNNVTLELATDRCLFEGQAALNGLMLYGKNKGI